MSPQHFTPFPLKQVQQLTHNVKLFRFGLPSEKHITGASVASVVLVMAEIDGKVEVRPYTPTSTPDQAGYFDLMIKVYPNGKMSQHIDKMKVGDCLMVKGPLQKFVYEPNSKKQMGLIAGGTGLTPMYQLIRKVLDNPDDHTKISLLYANVTPDDIMLREELEQLQAKHPDRFNVHFTVDRLLPETPKQEWKHDVGHVTKDMINKYIPASGPDTWVAVCGPPGFMNLLSGQKESPMKQGELIGILKEMGYTSDNVFKY